MRSDFKFSNLLATVYRQGNLVFTEDGKTLLSPVGNRVSVFDLINNAFFTFEYQHRKNISRIALNKQSTLLLSVDQDGRAILVNFKSRTVLHHFNFKNSIQDLKFSPDGHYFAVAVGRLIQVWKTPDINEDRQFAPFVRHRVYAGHYNDILSITWSNDSRFFLTTSKDMTSRIYSLHSEDKKAAITLSGHRDYVIGAFFDKNQEIIYTISKDGALLKWEYTAKPSDESNYTEDEDEVEDEDEHNSGDLTNKKMNWRITSKNYFFSDSKVKCATYHSQSDILVVGFKTGEFRIYEASEFILIQQLSMGQNAINSVNVNSSGEWLAFGSSTLGQLLVYEWKSESYVLKQQGHFDSMNCVCYSHDGSKLATASDDGKIKIWDVQSGFCLNTFSEHTSAVTQIQFSKKGNVLFSSSLDGTVRAWDIIRYRNFRTFTTNDRVKFTSLAVDPSGEVVCAASEDTYEIYVWSVQTSQILETLAGHEGPVSYLAFGSENSSVLVSASWDKTIRIWNIFSRSQQVEPFQLYADVLALAMRPDSKQVAVSTIDGQISFWDIENAKQVGNIDIKNDVISGRYLEDRFNSKNSARSKYFSTINYSFDGSALVAGGINNSICLYDINNGVLLRRFKVSENMSLNGTLKMLNSSKITEAGISIDLIDRDGENSDLDDRIDNALPGSSRGGADPSLRNVRPEIRVMSIQFSPTSSSFAAASTEGLLIYSIDSKVIFDPFDLDINITSTEILKQLNDKKFLIALVMAIRLNENHLILKVFEHIPFSDIRLILQDFPEIYLPKLLKFLSEFTIDSQHIEFNLTWLVEILNIYGKFIHNNKSKYQSSLRLIQRYIERTARKIVETSKRSQYLYEFIRTTKYNKDTIKLKEDAFNYDGTADDESIHSVNESDEEGEWLGPELNAKANKNYFSNLDSDSE
ncbi:snoRNA-binding rRNA-processing protein PWP2 [Ascoidea rubescens DSM 1968]|uniref:WD40 repeat-like protein n=1 Tax=Ascoidea rubescens DSM 1968 TaxID=1344418 RepID=A0A1D2VAQ4_9ASCO|nr:WD40 repeat-like protein [Ascoidea rubescens DSM 1968]ODV58507.1 WD40 repeat-like protein [Ascoidea rubescens DSM 1968]